MPRGTRHEETGRLNARDGWYSLRRDRGGTWRLDLGWRVERKARHLAGHRVRVVGFRDDFDLLAVEQIKEADATSAVRVASCDDEFGLSFE